MKFLIFLAIFLNFISPSIGYSWKDIFKSEIGLAGISAQCANDTETWMKTLEIFSLVTDECLILRNCTLTELKILESDLWALQQLDAFGKIPAGILEVSLLNEGSYQECQRISGKKYETNYCYLSLVPGRNITCTATSALASIRTAVCMPRSCNTEDLVKIFNENTETPFTACYASCSYVEVKKDSAFWGFSIFLIVVSSIAILATTVDFLRETVQNISSNKEKNIFLRLLLTFSFWTNAGLILSVKDHKPGFIKSLDCMRAFSMMWVVTGHTFIYQLPPDTLMSISTFTKRFWNHLILNAFVSVDTFFLLSGVVVSYLFFKERLKLSIIKSPVTWTLFYVHRYLRLTPPIMLFIGFFTVYGYYIQGPFSASMYNLLMPQVDLCKTEWWKNLLYINNFEENTCYAITWYLAVDTQIYVIAPIILVAFYFSFAAGTLFTVAGCVGSIITTYIIFYIYDLPADPIGNGDQNDFNGKIYNKPWIRCTPYLVGLMTGYIIAVYGKRKIRLSWPFAVLGWLIAFAIAFGALFFTYDYDAGTKWSIFSRATFYNFSRLGWAIALSWVIIANHMGWGGPIDNFMSHPIWQPFGRLSYCAYIVHWMVLFYFLNLGNRHIKFDSTWQTFLYYAVPATFMSYIFAFFWSCMFEIPILKLEKMLIEALIGGGKSGASNKVENQNKDDKVSKAANGEELWNIERASKL